MTCPIDVHALSTPTQPCEVSRDDVLCVVRFCMQFSEVPNMSEPNLELLSKNVSLFNIYMALLQLKVE